MKATALIPLMLAALALASCASTGSPAAAAASPSPAPAEAAAPAAAAAPAGLVAAFDDDEVGVSTYNGGGSTISAMIDGEVVHSGSGALVVETVTHDYSGAVIRPDPSRLDFGKATKFVFWFKGNSTNEKINIVFEDAGKEQFSTSFMDVSSDWKEFSLPLAKWKSRTDYQAGDAVVDKNIDYPLSSIHIFAPNTYSGTVYFDDISVQ